MARLLVVDEESKTLNILSTLLRTEGYKVVPVVGLEKSRAFIKAQHFDLAILDVSGNMEAALDLLLSARKDKPDLPIIFIHGETSPALAARAAAVNRLILIGKPLNLEEFLQDVRRVVDFQDERARAAFAPEQLVREMGLGLESIVGASPAMRAVCEAIKRVAPTEIAVLVWGEKGVEKEDIAKAIHHSSLLSAGPFVSLDCGGEPDEAKLEIALFGCAGNKTGGQCVEQKGVVEKSNRGTLFLNNVDSLPPNLQVKLNEALTKKKVLRGGAGEALPVKFRLVAGAWHNIEKMVQTGRFDSDLCKSLSLMPIHLKPLRERKEDIPQLVQAELRNLSIAGRGELSCDADAMSVLERYPWPGNTEELRQVIRRAAEGFDGNVITRTNLPSDIVAVASIGGRL